MSVNNRPPTPEEKHVYRCYFKHFHPDKFIGHHAYELVANLASLVNQCYSERLPNTCVFIVETGLMLKQVLKSK